VSTSIQPASASAISASTLFGATSGTSSASNSSTGAATDTLDQISQQVALMQQQADQAKITNVQDFQKQTNDVQIDNRMTARDVGTLRYNDSRLNVFSSLSKGDAADFFSFNVATSENTRFSVLTADQDEETNIRFQIISRSSGNVVADSDPSSGDAKVTYDQLKAGTTQLEAGGYVLRVTRMDDTVTNRNTEYNYAVQFTQGTYQKDFDTVEQAAQAGADPFGFAANASVDSLTSSLAASVSMLQALPPIGTSGTDKLSGLLLDNLF